MDRVGDEKIIKISNCTTYTTVADNGNSLLHHTRCATGRLMLLLHHFAYEDADTRSPTWPGLHRLGFTVAESRFILPY